MAGVEQREAEQTEERTSGERKRGGERRGGESEERAERSGVEWRQRASDGISPLMSVSLLHVHVALPQLSLSFSPSTPPSPSSTPFSMLFVSLSL